MELKTRKCVKCSNEFSEEYFDFKSKKLLTKINTCKFCVKIASKVFYDNNKHKYLHNAKERRDKSINRNKEFVINYLRTHPCVDCGESNIVVLEFDHLFDKKKEVSQMVGEAFSISKIQNEIEKCEVRCANCHRIKTLTKLGSYKLKYI